MGDVVDFPASLIDDREFVLACARYADGLLSEAAIKKRYRFDDETWERLGSNDALVAAIEAEKTRRIRNGDTARERAQVLYAETPTVLGGILHDDGASARHRIESARELRQIADNGPEAAAPASASDRFLIVINLGDEVLKYPNDTDPHNTATTPKELLPMIAAKKKDDGDGEPV